MRSLVIEILTLAAVVLVMRFLFIFHSNTEETRVRDMAYKRLRQHYSPEEIKAMSPDERMSKMTKLLTPFELELLLEETFGKRR